MNRFSIWMPIWSRRLLMLVTLTGTNCMLQNVNAEDVLTVFLKQPSPETFPCDDWYPPLRSEIEAEVANMNGLLDALASLDPTKRDAIKNCYDDRAGLVRGFNAQAMKDRIKKLRTEHEGILSSLRKIHWAKTPGSMVPFQFDNDQQRYQIQNLSFLICLAAISEFTEGDLQAASNTLGAGFAFAHNLTLTTGDLNVILGDTYKAILVSAVADLQSMGVPNLSDGLEKIESSLLSTETTERLTWYRICAELPVLRDEPRTAKQWRADLRSSLAVFDSANLVPENDAEAEATARQLQTIIQATEQIRLLTIPVEYKHGGVEGVKKLNPNEKILIKNKLNLLAITKYVESQLDQPNHAAARANARRSLCAARCIEHYRQQSLVQKKWADTKSVSFTQAIPMTTASKSKPIFHLIEDSQPLPQLRIALPSLIQSKRFDPRQSPEAKINVVQAWSIK